MLHNYTLCIEETDINAQIKHFHIVEDRQLV